MTLRGTGKELCSSIGAFTTRQYPAYAKQACTAAGLAPLYASTFVTVFDCSVIASYGVKSKFWLLLYSVQTAAASTKNCVAQQLCMYRASSSPKRLQISTHEKFQICNAQFDICTSACRQTMKNK